MNAALKSLVALAVGATGCSTAPSVDQSSRAQDSALTPSAVHAERSFGEDDPILTSTVNYTVRHRTGSYRSSYITATDPNVGEVKYIVGPSKSAKGNETQVRLKPSDNHSALQIESTDGAVYADCRSLSLAKANSAIKFTNDERTEVMRKHNIPWWVLRSTTAAAGADGTDIIMHRSFVPDATNPKNEVTKILFLGPYGSSVRTAWWDEHQEVWVDGPPLSIANTYTVLKFNVVEDTWKFDVPALIDDGLPADSDIESLVKRMNGLKNRAVSDTLDDPDA